MVDLRPLLLTNALVFMLLIMAAFLRLNDGAEDSAPAGGTVAEQTKTETQGKDIVSSETPAVEPQKEPPSSGTAIQQETSEPQDKPLPSREEAEAAVFKDEAIFADEVKPPHRDSATKAAVKSLEQQDDKPMNPMVLGYHNIPKKAPTITGKLIVRSNVHDDTVLVNGKPYGPTRLELDLTPGNYAVEVAKKGYNSWTTDIDIRRGQTRTIKAELKRFTKVDYVNGTWANGIKTGEGSYREDGVVEYKGSFVDGLFHGSGSARYADGSKYQGEWFEGMMEGYGTYTTPEGDTYVGEMDDDKFNGEGTLTKANGDIYTGFWIDGVLNGQGSLTTKDGLLYVGGFSDNLFHGNGSLTYPDGGHYEGSFSNGLYHGKGVEVYPSGKKYVGQFIEGQYHGKGEILNPNGSKITGTFKNGKPFGKATLTTAEGEVFTARSSEPGVCYRLKSYRATECPELEGW